jgi:hypothetical protein
MGLWIFLLLSLIILRLLAMMVGGVFATIDNILVQIARSIFKKNVSVNTGDYGERNLEKERERDSTRAIEQSRALDLFELNKLKLEQSLDHCHSHHTEVSRLPNVTLQNAVPIVIQVCDQVFMILDRNNESLALIQELLNEIRCAQSGMTASAFMSPGMSTAGVVFDARAAAAIIRDHIRMATYRSESIGRSFV